MYSAPLSYPSQKSFLVLLQRCFCCVCLWLHDACDDVETCILRVRTTNIHRAHTQKTTRGHIRRQLPVLETPCPHPTSHTHASPPPCATPLSSLMPFELSSGGMKTLSPCQIVKCPPPGESATGPGRRQKRERVRVAADSAWRGVWELPLPPRWRRCRPGRRERRERERAARGSGRRRRQRRMRTLLHRRSGSCGGGRSRATSPTVCSGRGTTG